MLNSGKIVISKNSKQAETRRATQAVTLVVRLSMKNVNSLDWGTHQNTGNIIGFVNREGCFDQKSKNPIMHQFPEKGNRRTSSFFQSH